MPPIPPRCIFIAAARPAPETAAPTLTHDRPTERVTRHTTHHRDDGRRRVPHTQAARRQRRAAELPRSRQGPLYARARSD
eukprot:2851406-Rhodomonas_salina.3